MADWEPVEQHREVLRIDPDEADELRRLAQEHGVGLEAVKLLSFRPADARTVAETARLELGDGASITTQD